MRRCNTCHEVKPLVSFPFGTTCKDGRRPRCNTCTHKTTQRWRDSQKRKELREQQRDTELEGRNRRPDYLKRLYGLSIQEFNQMLEAQDGRCAICGVEKCTTGQRLNVDHCHKTGRVRGILCKRCNTAIGMLQDDPELMYKAARYIKSHLQEAGCQKDTDSG